MGKVDRVPLTPRPRHRPLLQSARPAVAVEGGCIGKHFHLVPIRIGKVSHRVPIRYFPPFFWRLTFPSQTRRGGFPSVPYSHFSNSAGNIMMPISWFHLFLLFLPFPLLFGPFLVFYIILLFLFLFLFVPYFNNYFPSPFSDVSFPPSFAVVSMRPDCIAVRH